MSSTARSRENTVAVPAAVRVGRQLSKAFEQVEERIRERAYQLFQRREPDEGDSVSDWLQAQAQLLSPVALVLKEQKKNILIEGDLNGFSAGDIEIEVGVDQIKVFGSHAESETAKKAGATTASARQMSFYQALPLPCEVDPDACKATLHKNGKLKVTLPKKADSR